MKQSFVTLNPSSALFLWLYKITTFGADAVTVLAYLVQGIAGETAGSKSNVSSQITAAIHIHTVYQANGAILT